MFLRKNINTIDQKKIRRNESRRYNRLYSVVGTLINVKIRKLKYNQFFITQEKKLKTKNE